MVIESLLFMEARPKSSVRWDLYKFTKFFFLILYIWTPVDFTKNQMLGVSWVSVFIYVMRGMCSGKLGRVQKQEVQLSGCHGCCRSWYRYSGTFPKTLQLFTSFPLQKVSQQTSWSFQSWWNLSILRFLVEIHNLGLSIPILVLVQSFLILDM